MLIWLSLDYNF